MQLANVQIGSQCSCTSRSFQVGLVEVVGGRHDCGGCGCRSEEEQKLICWEGLDGDWIRNDKNLSLNLWEWAEWERQSVGLGHRKCDLTVVL